MTVEERLARVEAILSEQKDDIAEVRRQVTELVLAAHMGKGAWWLLLRLGALFVAILSAAGWVVHEMHR
jgi:hypothetical protein